MADQADDPTQSTPTSPTAALVIHVVLQVIAAVTSSLIAAGVFPDGSTAGKIAIIIAANLAALGYGATTTNKAVKAAVRATASRASSMLVAGLAVGAILGVAIQGCAGAPKPVAVFGSCTVISLEQDVGDGTLAKAVEQALLQDDYVGAIAGLVAKLGAQEVSCAVLAIDAIDGAGSGSVTPNATDRGAVLAKRADEVARKNGWK